jgi:hypothetical protein
LIDSGLLAWSCALQGAPSKIWTELTLQPASQSVGVSLQLWNKTTTRLPEALIVNFSPDFQTASGNAVDDSDQTATAAAAATSGTVEHNIRAGGGYGWAMDVLGSWVSS